MEQIGLEGVFKTEAFASGLSKYTSGLNKAVSDTTSAGGVIGKAIGTGVTIATEALAAMAIAAVAAAAATGSAILSIAVSTGKAAHELEILSAKTNLSTTALQEWSFAGQFLGLTADDISTYFFRLSRSAYAASQGTKASVDAFAQLGISVMDVSGNLKDTNTLFLEAIDAIGKMKNPTEQDAVAMAIFGRSAQDLFPLIKAGSKQLQIFTQQAHDVGAVLDEQTVAAFANFDDQLDVIKSSIKGLGSAFVSQFIPDLTAATGVVTAFLKDVHGIKSSTDLIKVGKIWMTKISAGMMQGLSILKKNLPIIMKKITVFLTQALPMLGDFGGSMISMLVKSIVDNAPAIVQAGRDILKALALGLSAGLSASNIKIPKFGDLVSWILGKATEMSVQFKAWVGSVDWLGFSNQIVAAISGLPWNFAGSTIGNIGRNLWDAINLAIFGGTVVTGGGTADMKTKIVKGIDWAAITVALSTAFDNAVIGALHTGLKLGDVTDLAGLQAEWANIGTQYGQVAGSGMAPTFWAELWRSMFSSTFGLTTGEAVAGLKANFAEVWQNVAGESWNEFWQDPLNFKASLDFWKNWFETSMNIWGGFFGTFLQTYFTDPFSYMLGQLTIAWDKFLILVNKGLALMNLPLIPLVPLGDNATPSTPIPNATPTGGKESSFMASSSRSTTNNITINNPSAEPASTSVSSTLRKLNYLGAT